MATRKAKPGAEPGVNEDQSSAAPELGGHEAGSPEAQPVAANDDLGAADSASDAQVSGALQADIPVHPAHLETTVTSATPPKASRYSKANARERAAARKLNLQALKKQRAGTVAIQFHLQVFHAGTSKDRLLSLLTLVERTAAQIRVGNGQYLAPKTAETMLTVLDNALVKFKEDGDEAQMQASALRNAAQAAATEKGFDLGQPVLVAEISADINCTDSATVATCQAVMGFDAAMLDLEFLQVATGQRSYSTQIATVRSRFVTGVQTLSKVCVGLLRQTEIARSTGEEPADAPDDQQAMGFTGE